MHALLESGRQDAVAVSRPSRSDIQNAIRTLIPAAGDDPDREGLQDTPARVARAYREWFAGYRLDPAALLSRTFSEEAGYRETVLLRSIPVVSTCEHHLAPILGWAHVGYRPDDPSLRSEFLDSLPKNAQAGL
jgi:GTP cyclohydrolase IA